MPKVEIYVKTMCGYCFRARQLLDAKGVEAVEHVVDMGGEKKHEMVERAGGRMTVPQIFIDGKHIGGCDELFRLERTGQLDEMLAA